MLLKCFIERRKKKNRETLWCSRADKLNCINNYTSSRNGWVIVLCICGFQIINYEYKWKRNLIVINFINWIEKEEEEGKKNYYSKGIL